MNKTDSSQRPGFTLIEILFFVAIFSIVAAVMLPLLFSSTETRLRQQTIALVDDNGAQALQYIVRRVRNAERVLYPPAGSTGSFLAVQTASGSLSPTIFAVQTGSILMIEGAAKQTLTSEKIAVQNFTVRNTSISATVNSVAVSFDTSRTIRLHAPHTYRRMFDVVMSLLPADQPQGDSCGCDVPVCSSNELQWQICQESVCVDLLETADCS